jgi:hypothetical protein
MTMSETLIGSVEMDVPFSLDELADLIRQIVREEVSAILEERGFYSEPTIVEPGSPIYEDLVDTLKMAEEGTLQILTREETFGE